MVHGGAAVQLADGGHNAKGVSREEDDGLWVSAYAGDLGILNIVDRVAHAGVFRQALIGKVKLAGFGVHHHVFHQRAEADGVPDVRLMLL